MYYRGYFVITKFTQNLWMVLPDEVSDDPTSGMALFEHEGEAQEEADKVLRHTDCKAVGVLEVIVPDQANELYEYGPIIGWLVVGHDVTPGLHPIVSHEGLPMIFDDRVGASRYISYMKKAGNVFAECWPVVQVVQTFSNENPYHPTSRPRTVN